MRPRRDRVVSKQRENAQTGKPEPPSIYRRMDYWGRSNKRGVEDVVQRSLPTTRPTTQAQDENFPSSKANSFLCRYVQETTHQMTQQYFLFRCTKESGIFGASEEWRDWRRRANIDQYPPSRHFMVDREVFASRLAKWKKASSRKPRRHTIKILLKRTPYSQYKGPRARFGGRLRTPLQ